MRRTSVAAISALVVLPVVVLTYLLVRTDVWEGEVPVVVNSVRSNPGQVSVKLIAPLPSDALRRQEIGSGIVEEPPTLVRPGDLVTCRIRQTYRVSRDITAGPQTEILSCRR